jgi:cyclase
MMSVAGLGRGDMSRRRERDFEQIVDSLLAAGADPNRGLMSTLILATTTGRLHLVNAMLRAGADKVAINTAAVQRPQLISEVARRFGSQCMVISIEAKKRSEGYWEVYTDCGREQTGMNAIDWARQAAALGAGEVLITSIDREGTRKGYDLELTRTISDDVGIPVIASGGYGNDTHLLDVVEQGGADAVAVADALHYDRTNLIKIRAAARAAGIQMRQLP